MRAPNNETVSVLCDLTIDEELVTAAINGDPDAFGVLYRRHQPYLSKVIASRVGDPNTQADIEQETFAKAFTRLADLRNRSAFRPWISQIARRLATDSHRASQRIVWTDFTDPDTACEPVDSDWGPEQWTAMRLLADSLNVGLSSLARRDAVALTMAANLGFNPTEIAVALGIEPGNARVILHRARKRLAASLVEALGESVQPEVVS